MVRYPTGLIGHVVVAPATFQSHETTQHSTCHAHTVMCTCLCGIGYGTMWYRIRYGVVSDVLHGPSYIFFKHWNQKPHVPMMSHVLFSP